jgi:hypothetical protein
VTAATERKERLALRLYNGAQGLLTALGRKRPRFRDLEDPLHEAAAKAVGVRDFGDQSYRRALRILLRSYDDEARLTPFGRMMVEQMLGGILRNRLLCQKAWTDNPSILKNEIHRPIFILGLPRTGTTALHHLLGQDSTLQVLEYWLAAAPKPRPPRETWEKDSDFKRAVRELKTTYWLDPSLKAIHLMTAEGPEECRHLLAQSFTDDTFDCNATIPSYSSWYETCDMELIGSSTPAKRWLLKYPVHMRNLRTVLATYPDACFIYCHRDPAKVLPSLCSLVAGWRAIAEGTVDRPALARWQMNVWAAGMEHAIEVRREMKDESRFFDLAFSETVADPIGAVKRIYARFEVPLTEEAERRLDSWRQENPRGKHGEHHYTLEEFGLTRTMVYDRYARYLEHFKIPHEIA